MYIEILTHYQENYAAPEWDGRGICPEYWKYKGGYEYIITDVTPTLAASQQFWEDVQKFIEHKTNFSMEYIVEENLVDEISDAIAVWNPKLISAKEILDSRPYKK